MNGLQDLVESKGSARLIRQLARDSLLIKDDYPRFIEILYSDMDDISYEVNKNPKRRSSDLEDRVTDEVILALNMLGYRAIHDNETGGHVDVTVELGPNSWIAEAKIDTSNTKIYEGFLQLTTRYNPASGNWKHNQGGMLIYVKKPNMKDVQEKWKKYLSEQFKKEQSLITFNDCENNIFAFYSTHIHEKTGKDFVVRHIPFFLHHDPKDASGRKKK